MAGVIEFNGVHLFPQVAPFPAPPGDISIQNILGVLKQVNDQGVASTLGGGGGGGFPATATAVTKDNTGTPSANIPLSGLSGPGLLKFAADGTPSKGVVGTDYGYTGPYDAITQFALSQYPSLTSFRGTPLGMVAGGTQPIGNVSADSGLLEGGSLRANNVSSITFIDRAWFQTPKTGPWFMAWRGKMLGGGVASHDNKIDLLNAAATHGWHFGRQNAISATKWSMQLVGTSTVNAFGTKNADSAIHTHAMGMDGTTVKYWIDPVIGDAPDVTQTTIAQMADEPMFPGMYSGTLLETDMTWAFRGFVAP